MKRTKIGFVYIMTNKWHTVLYTGVTNNIERRVFEHKQEFNDGFTKKYKCHKLVYFEEAEHIVTAIEYEKKIKGWSRQKKESLINKNNPQWEDLAQGWL